MSAKLMRFFNALPKANTVLEAGTIAGYNHPHVESYRALERIRKNPELSGILARAGLLPYTIAKKIRKKMDAKIGIYHRGIRVGEEEDNQAQLRALELASNLTGLMPSRHSQQTIELGNNLSKLLNETMKATTQNRVVEAPYSVESQDESSAGQELIQETAQHEE